MIAPLEASGAGNLAGVAHYLSIKDVRNRQEDATIAGMD
jgi:hypothetical protein